VQTSYEFDPNGGGRRLCNNCTSILADGNVKDSGDTYVHPGHDHLHLLESRAEAGCLICGIALRELSKRLGDSVLPGEAVITNILAFDYDHLQRLQVIKPRSYVLEYVFSHEDVSCGFDIQVAPSQREYH
jgi:hypothetical protein